MQERISNIDEILACGKRSLRTLPNSRLMGPTGARLWVDYVELLPGFAGAVDFIHKCNIPLLFTIDSDFRMRLDLGDSQWKPSHLSMAYSNSEVSFSEEKFISWDDCAVSLQTWENRSMEPKQIKLRYDEEWMRYIHADQAAKGVFSPEQHSFDITTVIISSFPELWEGVVLQPGQSVRFTITAAFGIHGSDSEKVLRKRAERFITEADGQPSALDIQREEYLDWFNKVPSFTSSDPLLDKTWLYRWFILRHNLADPQYGNLQYPLFYEGRSHKMSKTPGSPEGWEFSKLIPLSSPMHLLESRWHHDPAYGEGVMATVQTSQDDNGLYNCLYVDSRLHSYANFMGWAVFQYYLVHRNEDTIRNILPSLKRQVDGEAVVYGNEKDKLLIEYNHKRTGKEYQPSYWYFHDFPDDCQDETVYTPLKRVDRTVYHYLNCLGVANLCHLTGDPDSERFLKLAEQIERDLKEKMWDEGESFFFDLHYQDDRKAYVKNIVGFYPFWAEVTEPKHRDSLHYLLDENGFQTSCPLPSVSVDCQVFAPGGGWKGHFIKGRNGCVWNGPTWPYTNSVVLDGLAKESKRAGHRYDALFSELLREYSWLHYSGRDLARPYLIEHYNSLTGEPISDEVDYNHSYYIDLIVRHVVGLEIGRDKIVLDPIHMGLDYFELANIKAAGRTIRVTYGKPGTTKLPVEKGFRLYIDGTEVVHSRDLQAITYTL